MSMHEIVVFGTVVAGMTLLFVAYMAWLDHE